jgi:hypothetical protein
MKNPLKTPPHDQGIKMKLKHSREGFKKEKPLNEKPLQNT